jgi:hypothetical protein
MIILLVKGSAHTPQRFWQQLEIDPETQPDEYAQALKVGYVKSNLNPEGEPNNDS